MKKIFIVIVFLISFSGRSQDANTVEWTLLLGGKSSGFVKQLKNPDGSYTDWSQIYDRGRGDSTVTNYKYDNNGTFVFIDGKGVDYFKKPVFEKYWVENGVAHWENNSEKSEKKIDGITDYVPLKIFPGSSFGSYFKTPSHTIKLLPTGSSKLTVLQEYTLKDGKKIRLASIIGTSLTPSYTWIDENNQWFANPDDWMAYFRKGYESYNDELLKIQDEYKNKYFKEIAKTNTEKIKNGLVITNANLFDTKTGKVNPNATILIENGKIKQVSNQKIKTPPGYKVIDAKGRFVMPGLWDMHVHYTDDSQGLLHLSCGVTNVRDMGNAMSLVDKKKEIDNGIVLGPRIQVMCGLIDGAGQYAAPIGVKINSVEEGKTAIKNYADLGYTQIKLYSSIKPEWVKPLADDAKKYNMRVSGHIPSKMIAEEAVNSGYNEIQHITMLFLNFYGKDLDTRSMTRFTTVGEKAASFDFNSPEFKSFLSLLKQKNITVDPTVTVFENMFTGKEGETNATFTSVESRLPLSLQRELKSGSALEITNDLQETYKKSFSNLLKMIKVLYDNKISIVAGTDDFAGFTLQRELESYVTAGIPNAEVLKIATIGAATIAQKSNDYGSIEEGKAADIIIVDGDPTKNIRDIRKVEIIVKDNDIYNAKDLLSTVSIGYFK